MWYTVRFAHLANKPPYKEGDTLYRGDVVGKMGSSGQSTAPHLHIDCVEGKHWIPFKLHQIGTGLVPAKKQLDYFIDEELFGTELLITTGYMDPEYRRLFGKDHPAYDVVPASRHSTTKNFLIHWNRSHDGEVVLVAEQPESYGHCVYIAFEA